MCVLEAGWDASSPHTQQPSAGQHPHGHRVGKMGDHMGKADTPELPFTPPPSSPMGCLCTHCSAMMGAMNRSKCPEICRACSSPASPALGHNGQNTAWQRGVCWQGAGSAQHFRKRAAPSLLGISFGGGTGSS